MAISTYKVFLMKKDASNYAKLVDITAFPDLGGTPEMLDTTTLSNAMRTSIPGILDVGDGLEFSANYTKEDYKKLVALKGQELEYAVWLGGTESAGEVTPTGEDGKFEFKGFLTVYPTGGGVNEVVGMNITIAPTTDIVEKSA